MAYPRSGLERSGSDIAVERFFACCCHITNSFALFVCLFWFFAFVFAAFQSLIPLRSPPPEPAVRVTPCAPPFAFVLASKIASTLLLLALFPCALSQRCPPYLAVKSLFVLPTPSPFHRSFVFVVVFRSFILPTLSCFKNMLSLHLYPLSFFVCVLDRASSRFLFIVTMFAPLASFVNHDPISNISHRFHLNPIPQFHSSLLFMTATAYCISIHFLVSFFSFRVPRWGS